MAVAHLRAGALPHQFQLARLLVDTPVVRSRDEARRLIDGAAGKQSEVRVRLAGGAAAVPVEPTLESGASELGAVDTELILGEPAASGDLGGARHLLGDGLRHALGEIH